MYVPFPRKIDYAYGGGFAAVLGAVLLAEGNPARLCLIVAAQVIVSVAGFNLARGLRSPTGAYVFFVTMFTGMLGTFLKAILNERLMENVANADKTLAVYLAGTCAMVVAVKLSRYFVPQRAFLEGMLTWGNTNQLVAGCLVLAFVMPVILWLLSGQSAGSGSLTNLVAQLNYAAPLAILIGVYLRVKQTNGRSSFSTLILVIWFILTLLGLLSFSKEGSLFPTFAWILAAVAARLRFTLVQVIAITVLVTLGMLFLVPFSQYGRNFRGQDSSITYDMLLHPLETREKALAVLAVTTSDPYHWFREQQGIFDRLTLLPIDSALIARTDQVGQLGLRNVFLYFQNILPHFLLPDKPDLNTGNQYAHELGMLADDDTSTGISFSPFGEAYHLYGWMGVLLVMPLLQLLLFVVVEWTAGTVDQSPWALFYIVQFGHKAAEGSLIQPIYMLSVGTEALIATAFAMVYIAPVIGGLIVGPGRPSASDAQAQLTGRA